MAELSIQEVLDRGIAAHRSGNIQEADRNYTAILKAVPDHPDANHNLGILAVSLGKVSEALPLFRRALKSNPKIEQFWLSLIGALIKLEKYEEAKASLESAYESGFSGEKLDKLANELGSKSQSSSDIDREALKKEITLLTEMFTRGEFTAVIEKANELQLVYPASSVLQNLKGASHASLKQYEEAVTCFKKSIEINPDNAATYNDLGNVLRSKGDLHQAIDAFQIAIKLNPKPQVPDLLKFKLAQVLIEIGHYNDAITILKNILITSPEFIDAKFYLADIYYRNNEFNFAITQYNELIEIIECDHDKLVKYRREHTLVYSNLIGILVDLGDPDQAISILDKAKAHVQVAPNQYLFTNIAKAYSQVGNTKLAIDNLKIASDIDEKYPVPFKNLASIYIESGDLILARQNLMKAIELDPSYCEAHRNLSTITTYKDDTDHLKQMQEIAASTKLSPDQMCHLMFALAKAHEDIDDYEAAFDYYSQGNTLRKKLLNYDIQTDVKISELLKSRQPEFTEEFLKDFKLDDSVQPIFIVGLPRSGTTLVEQILSQHENITAAGELDYIRDLAANLLRHHKPVKPQDLLVLRESYLDKISHMYSRAGYVTDKMPHNFLFIPQIIAAFPRAQIIHVTRDRAATCWSSYKTYFDGRGLGYCYDLKDLMDYYDLYADLIQVWQTEYPNRIINCNYDSLAAEPEVYIRKLIETLDFTWDDRFLRPHENKRNVKTASNQQVRKEIYRGSSDAWKKYKPYLPDYFH